MRADEHALAALDAERLVPLGNFQGDVALLPLRGADGIGSIAGQLADREVVAVAEDHGRQDILHEGRRLGGDRRTELDLAGGLGRNLDAMEIGESAIDGGEVLV